MSDHLKPYQFKPGESGNPLGGQLHDKEVKIIKNLSKEEMVEMGSILIKGDWEELEKISLNPKGHSPLKIMIARCVQKIASKGDPFMLDVLLNRLIGKVKEQIDIKNMPVVHIQIPSNGREVRDEKLDTD